MRYLGPRPHFFHASTERELEVAFAILVQLQTGALIIGGDIFFP
jgi:hypothetical protein